MPRYASKARQDAEEARHRQEILEASIRVFAERGFHAATMRDVAQAAAFSVGKLYLHFPSKEALYQELLDRYVDDIVVVIDEALGPPGRAAERIERLVRRSLEYLERNPLLLRLFVNETLGFELRIQTQFGRSFATRYERMLSRIRQTLEKGLAAGEFRGGTAEELALKFSGIFNAVLAAETRRSAPRRAPEVAEVVLRLFYEGSRRRS